MDDMNVPKQNIMLEDEVAILRPLLEEDLQHLLHFALHEKDLWPYALQNPAGEDGMRVWLKRALKNKAMGKEFPFIVFDKRVNRYAGSTRFSDINISEKTTQISYSWYGKEFQRTGLNRRCKFLLLKYCFEEWDMERVEFRADVNNKRSIEALKAIGCTVEGVLRSDRLTDRDCRRSSMIFSILKEEWFGWAKKNLQQKIK